jgi:hypothetical protein
MSFNSGQRVRLTRDLVTPNFTVAENSVGTVDSVDVQTRVLFDGVKKVLTVADNDIVDVRADQPMLKPALNDDVRLLKEHHTEDGRITSVGSVGKVVQVNVSGGLFRVAFDPASPIWVLIKNLEKA